MMTRVVPSQYGKRVVVFVEGRTTSDGAMTAAEDASGIGLDKAIPHKHATIYPTGTSYGYTNDRHTVVIDY